MDFEKNLFEVDWANCGDDMTRNKAFICFVR